MSDIVKALIDANAEKIAEAAALRMEVNRLALECAALREERDELKRSLAQWVKSHEGLSKQLEKHTTQNDKMWLGRNE